MKIIGALLVIFGIVDFAGTDVFGGLNVWSDWFGIELTGWLYTWSPWMEMVVGGFLYNLGGGDDGGEE